MHYATEKTPYESAIHTWCYPPTVINLAGDQVHLWRASLDLAEEALQSLLLTLTSDELERMERYRFARDRTHFIGVR